MENKLYTITYKWKDAFDDVAPSEAIVTDREDAFDEGLDEDIFYYGLTEELIQEAIKLGTESEYEFLILSYYEIN